MESSFTDDEKRFVLAEMIKTSQMDVGVLVEFVKLHEIHPDWFSMQLPGGRNMHQCWRAAETMFNMTIQPPIVSPLKRKSFSDVPDHFAKRQAVASPGEGPSYAPPRSANLPAPPPPNVNIQPRPNGYAPPPLAPSPTVPAPPPPASAPAPMPTLTPTGRKRGRPPKSETLARQLAPHMGMYQFMTPTPIAPSPAPPANTLRPLSPRLLAQSGPQPPYSHTTSYIPLSPKAKPRQPPIIAPRPAPVPAPEPSPKLPAPSPGSERDYHEREYHERRGSASTPREPGPTLNPILPPRENPYQHHSDPAGEAAARAMTGPETTRTDQPAATAAN